MSREFNGSLVMEEFFKIAKENNLITTKFKQDSVGNPKEPTPVKDYRRYEPTEEYDVTKNKDVVELAHPKKVQVADCMGEGSVVENLNEQQKKDIEIATKMPSGALIGVHADVINNLIKLANELDEKGKYKEAKYIDEAIKKITIPFDNSHLYKEAFWGAAINIGLTLAGMFGPNVIDWWNSKKDPLRPGRRFFPRGKTPVGWKGKAAAGVITGIGMLGALGNKITSYQGGIKADTKDLIDILQKADSSSTKKAISLLQPIAVTLTNPQFGSEEGYREYFNAIKKVNLILPQLERYIIAYTQIEEPSMTGFGLGERVSAKFEDFKTSLDKVSKTFADMQAVAGKASQYAQEDLNTKETFVEDNNIKELQEVLFNRGFKGTVWSGEVTGELDENTINAARELEKELDNSLRSFTKKEGLEGTMVGEIVKNNNKIIDIKKLRTILEEVEKL